MRIRSSSFTLKTVSSYSTNPPGSVQGGGKTTRTARVRIAGRGGVAIEVPCVPGRALKSALHHGMAEEVVSRAGGSVDFHELVRLTSGGMKSSGETSPMSPKEVQAFLASNPHFDLFGGGDLGIDRFVDANFGVGDAILDEADLSLVGTVEGVRANLSSGAWRLLSSEGLEQAFTYGEANRARSRANGIVNGLKSKLAAAKRDLKAGHVEQSVVDGLEAELSEAKAELDNLAALAKDSGSDNSLGMPLPPLEYVGAGATFHSSLSTKHVTDVQAGLMLRSIERWADGLSDRVGCFLGGHQSKGWGRFEGELRLQAREDGFKSPWRDVGSVTFNPTDGAVIHGDELHAWLEAWDAFGQEAKALAAE